MEPERPEGLATPEGDTAAPAITPEVEQRVREAHMAAARRVLKVRLAAWGTVLVMAVGAFTLRAGASTAPDNGANGPQVNGVTEQSKGIWSVSDGDRIRELRMVWRFACENGGELTFGMTLRDSVDNFRYRGERFEFTTEEDLPPGGDGWVAHISARIDGELRGAGSSAGASEATMTFRRGEQQGTTCRSGPVRWTIGA